MKDKKKMIKNRVIKVKQYKIIVNNMKIKQKKE